LLSHVPEYSVPLSIAISATVDEELTCLPMSSFKIGESFSQTAVGSPGGPGRPWPP